MTEDENRRPSFQFYPADFMSDENVQLMTLDQIGAYWWLCCICWRQGSIPSDRHKLARLCRTVNVEKMDELWEGIKPCFKEHPTNSDRLIHPRLEKEKVKQDKYRQHQSESGKRGAKVRWDKDIDGGAIATPTQSNGDPISDDMATPMANDSSSTSSSSSTPTSVINNTDFVSETDVNFTKRIKQTKDYKDWCAALDEKTGNKGQAWNNKYKARWEHALKHVGLEKMIEIIEPLRFKNVEYLLNGSDGTSRGALVEATDEAIRQQNRSG